MSTIVLDSQAIDVLRKCVERVEFRDEQGNILGYFEPPARVYASDEIPPFDEAELDRREQRWAGIPSSGVRRRLEQQR